MMIEKSFGRIPQWNAASDGWRVSQLLSPLMDRAPRSYTWNTYLSNTNQRRYGACVGFTLLKEWASKPQVITGLTNEDGFQIYFDIQDIDGYPGSERGGANPAVAGTSVHAAADLSKRRGVWTNYLWARTAGELRTAVCYAGPVVIGVDWRTGSMDTDSDGYIHPTGQIEGGHAVLVYRYNKPGRFYEIDNHWTEEWGINGKARIHEEEIDGYLTNAPELCVPIRSSLRHVIEA